MYQCNQMKMTIFKLKSAFIKTNLKTTCTANPNKNTLESREKEVQSPDLQTHLVQLSLELWLERNRAKSRVRINKSLGL